MVKYLDSNTMQGSEMVHGQAVSATCSWHHELSPTCETDVSLATANRTLHVMLDGCSVWQLHETKQLLVDVIQLLLLLVA